MTKFNAKPPEILTPLHIIVFALSLVGMIS